MTTGRLLGRLAALSARWDWKQRATALFGHRRRAQHWSRRAARFSCCMLLLSSLSSAPIRVAIFFSSRRPFCVVYSMLGSAANLHYKHKQPCGVFYFFFSSPTNPSFSRQRWIKFILNTIFQWAFQSLLSGSPMNSVSRGRSATLFSPEERKTFINKISKVSYFKCFNWSSKRKKSYCTSRRSGSEKKKKLHREIMDAMMMEIMWMWW